MRVLARMERAGIRIDQRFLAELSAELNKECDRLQKQIWAHAGEEFNVNSTPQLRVVLFEKLGLTPVKKTKTGPSTDADSLQKMAENHPIVADLLRYREVEKLRGTYADALPPLVREDGRVHARFKQTDTTTGRISSSDPNLQNIPVRTADGREFRRAFVAEEGAGLLTADYSQIELRVLADLAEDPGLIDAFDRGVDIHTATAAKVFHRRRDGGHGRGPALRQGRELRPRVRDGGLRARPADGCADRGGARDPRRLLRGVPQRRAVHVGDRRRGEAARLHLHHLRAPTPDQRAVVGQLPHPSDGGADGAERADRRARRPTSSSWRWSPSTGHSRRAGSRPRCCSPCTTSWSSRCRRSSASGSSP